MTPHRALRISIGQHIVGALREEAGLWSLQYSAAWLDDLRTYALSPHLPLRKEPLRDGASVRPVQWYFDNLLPEEGQRALLAADAKLDAADAFGLLAYYGAESAGSVTLHPVRSARSGALKASDTLGALRPLPDSALSRRIQEMPRLPLTHNAPKRMSLAGAQHKLAVVLQDGALYEPRGARPSLHILKPDHPDPSYPHSAVNEWFIMRLAGQLGLAVPAVRRRCVPESVYLVDRFDRIQSASGWERRHVIDACQLLGLDRSFKYAAASMDRLAELANACRGAAIARARLFMWVVFNALTGNGDAHLKNLSFLVSEAGIQLAPHYDLLCTAVYESGAFDANTWPKQTPLAWPLPGARRFAQLNHEVMLDAAQALGIARTTAQRLLRAQCERIIGAADEVYQLYETKAAQLSASRSELRATLAGESRCLRAIIHGVVREMAARLS